MSMSIATTCCILLYSTVLNNNVYQYWNNRQIDLVTMEGLDHDCLSEDPRSMEAIKQVWATVDARLGDGCQTGRDGYETGHDGAKLMPALMMKR